MAEKFWQQNSISKNTCGPNVQQPTPFLKGKFEAFSYKNVGIWAILKINVKIGLKGGR